MSLVLANGYERNSWGSLLWLLLLLSCWQGVINRGLVASQVGQW